MYWDGSGYACVRLAYQLVTLPFFYLYITMATSLDLRNPQRKAARYVAWKAAIRRKSAGHTHTHT
jgi:hypothetical protein